MDSPMESIYSVQVGGLLYADGQAKASESPGIKKALGLGCEQRVNHIVLKHTSQRKVQTMQTHHPKKIQAQLEIIARDHLFIQTLETQMSDRLDFHEVSVWAIQSALEAAYEAGRAEAMSDSAAPKQTKRN